MAFTRVCFTSSRVYHVPVDGLIVDIWGKKRPKAKKKEKGERQKQRERRGERRRGDKRRGRQRQKREATKTNMGNLAE